MLNEVLKVVKNDIRWYKNWVKQEKKELVTVSCIFSQKYLLKTWNTM